MDETPTDAGHCRPVAAAVASPAFPVHSREMSLGLARVNDTVRSRTVGAGSREAAQRTTTPSMVQPVCSAHDRAAGRARLNGVPR